MPGPRPPGSSGSGHRESVFFTTSPGYSDVYSDVRSTDSRTAESDRHSGLSDLQTPRQLAVARAQGWGRPGLRSDPLIHPGGQGPGAGGRRNAELRGAAGCPPGGAGAGAGAGGGGGGVGPGKQPARAGCRGPTRRGLAGAWRGPNACASCPADEPGAWSGPAAAAPGLQEVGASLEDVPSPFSPSHPAPPSDPSHQRSPDPTWETQREHDVRKPKELSAGGQKKQRLGEQRERSASPQRAARPRLEEAPGGLGRPEAGRAPSEARAPGPAAAADAARAGGKEGPRAATGPELGRREGPGAAPGLAGPGGGGGGGAREAEGRAGARAGPRPGARPPGGAPARKAAVAPGPWKVPGSDKLSGVLQPGASAAGR